MKGKDGKTSMSRTNLLALALPALVAGMAQAACGGGGGSGDGNDGGTNVLPEASAGLDGAKAVDGATGSDGATTGPDGSGPTDTGSGGNDASDGAAPPKCTAPLGPNEECRNGLPAPVFQGVPAGFYMDVTEVTRSQYAAWLATKPPTASQVAGCQGNTTFQPDATCMANKLVCATSCDAHPQVCVDWCDAQAYCQGLGKQLCGARPDAIAQGLTVTFADFGNAELDQYQYVCSADGKQQYVYADTYDATACNTGCAGTACKTVAAASKAKCQGEPNSSAFPGIFDLNGNAAEWDGVCASADPAAQCHVRGGDMQATATTSACIYGAGVAIVARNVAQPTVGFRCCSSQ
jgi:sulfatase modifying factor 1